jgi:NAD(P)-dependent dehydrogenase (short-subunit alcohol dehydrogenase family)
MEMFSLDRHVAVVTGGNRGIGLGMARGLAKAGARVAVWARDPAATAAAVSELGELGPGAVGIECDVADEGSVAEALDATLGAFDRVDSLFANAGTTGVVRFEEMDTAEWDRVINVNLKGVFLTSRAVAQQLIAQGEGGSMAFTASLAARFGLGQSPHYSASKGAVLQLARSEAIRLARYGIRVNVISPGWIDTDMTVDTQAHERANQAVMARTPLRRWGTADDFEGIAVYLASSAAGFVTGSQFRVDGGLSAS